MKKMASRFALPVLALALGACGGGGDAGGTDTSRTTPAATTPPAAPATDTSKAGAPTQTAAVDGRAVYARTCQTCHQANGAGLPGAFPPLTESEYVNGSKGRLIRLVLHGLQGPITVKGQTYNSLMTPWKSLSDAEIAAVLTYERSNFGNSSSAVTAAEVAAERAATSSRTTPYTVAELGR